MRRGPAPPLGARFGPSRPATAFRGLALAYQGAAPRALYLDGLGSNAIRVRTNWRFQSDGTVQQQAVRCRFIAFVVAANVAWGGIHRMFYDLLVSIINGVLVGSIYGLAAIGLTLIFGVMNVINLMHGATIALGMFALYFLVTSLGLNPYLALLPVFAGGFLAGVVVYWVAVHRVIDSSELMSLLATYAVNMIIIGLGTLVWSTSPYNVIVSLPDVTLHQY